MTYPELARLVWRVVNAPSAPATTNDVAIQCE